MKKYLLAVIGVLSAFAYSFAFPQLEVWESATGSKIEATFAGQVAGQYWLRDENNKIYKVTPEQLEPFYAKRAQRLAFGYLGNVIESVRKSGVPTEFRDYTLLLDCSLGDTDCASFVEQIVTTLIPGYWAKKIPLEDALALINEEITKQGGDRIEFELAPEIDDGRVVNLRMRGLYLHQLLEMLGRDIGCASRVEGGTIVITPVRVQVVDPSSYPEFETNSTSGNLGKQ